MKKINLMNHYDQEKQCLNLINQKIQQAELARLRRENDRLSMENAFKKNGSVLRERVEVRYAMIKENVNQFSVTMMCCMLSVSSSGYYFWLKKLVPKREKEKIRLTHKIKSIINSNHKLPVAPDLLQQDFSAMKPNKKWVSDITYIWTDEG